MATQEDSGQPVTSGLNMNTVSTFEETLRCLRKEDIEKALPHRNFTRAQKRSRAALKDAVMALPQEDRAVLAEMARERKRLRIGENPVMATSSMSSCTEQITFFETVPEEIRCERISKFIDATGNEALATGVCAICAGRFFSHKLSALSLEDLRDSGQVVPTVPHPAHILTEGMLLHHSPASIFTDENGVSFARTCGPCSSSLQKKKTPACALANGMWIGDVPLELKVLTLPERILVARHFPAAYIVKLYPKKKGAQTWAEKDSLHCGLQGNVSTYRLNTADVAVMTGGTEMPPPARILAATVGVTFVGPGNLPERTLPGFLRVNKMRIRQALEWLQKNNPLYEDIKISTDRLDELPDEGVPVEITSLARHLQDEKLLGQETDGYVPEDDEENEPGKFCLTVS